MAIELATDQTIRLQDGRQLGFAIYGRQDGHPVFFFHGGNNSRLAGALLEKGAVANNAMIIAPDRPGFGLSDFQQQRSLLDWPKDIAALADHLQLQSFKLIGHSGGGPHALATAYSLADRCQAVALVSSAAPPAAKDKRAIPFRMIGFLARRFPAIHRRILADQGKKLRKQPTIFLQQWGWMSKADGRLFTEQPEIAELLVADMIEADRNGIDGAVHEHHLYVKPWGFELDRINTPVDIWCGLADVMAPSSWGEFLERQLANSHGYYLLQEGHVSLLVNQQNKILKQLLEH